MAENKITFLQTACLLVICRVTVTLTYTPLFSIGGFTTADLLAVAFALPVVIAEYIPVFLLAKKKNSVVTLAYRAAKPFGHAFSVLYALFFIAVAAISAARFDIFITTCVFPKTTAIGFVLLIVILAGVSALRGIEGAARAATVLILFVLASIILLLLVPVKQYDTLNILSPFIYGGEKIFSTTVTIISHSAEAAMLSVLIINVRRGAFKGYLIFSLVSSAIIAAIIATVILLVGDYSSVVLFPYYTASSITTIGSFSSLSPVLIGIWIIAVYLKCTLCICICMICLEKIIKRAWITAAASSVLILTAAIMLGRGMKLYNILFTPDVSLIACLVFTFVLPFSVLLAGGRKNEKN